MPNKIEVVISANDQASKKIEGVSNALTGTATAAASAGAAYDKMTANTNRLNLVTLQLADAQRRLATETDPMKQAQLRVEIDNLAKSSDNLQRELGESTTALSEMSGQSKGVSVLGMSLTDLKSGISLVTGAAQTAGKVIKAAFDFTEEGAAINQTRASFDRLGVSLDEMRAKSLGTIDDMTLMSSTLTLTAGASESMQAKLLGAAPELLEIAKAANALNPTLGDTAYMYQSIATGIKRASPMILDNLGIVVNVGKANEVYAAALGKTVEMLTAEEKSTALLNATMEAGQRLIEQNGNTVESSADAWARMRVEIKNATDASKANLAEAVLPLIVGLADQLQLMREIDEAYGKQARSAAYVTSHYGRGFREEAKTIQELSDELDRVNAATSGYAAMLDFMTPKQEENIVVTSGSVTAFGQYTDAIERSQTASDQLNYKNAQAQLDELAKSAEIATARVDGIKWSTSQNLTDKLEDGKEKLEELRTKAGELQTKVKELEGLKWRTTAQETELSGLREQLGDINGDIDNVITGMREMSAQFILNLIEMKISADGNITEAEASFMAGYARQQGLIDDLAVKQAGIVTTLVDDINAGTIDATEAIGQIGNATDELVVDFTEIDESVKPVFENVNAGFGSAAQQALQIAENVKEAQKAIDGMEGKSIVLDVLIKERRTAAATAYTPDIFNEFSGTGQASGGDYMVSRPTAFIAGDAGLERALFIPQGHSGFGGNPLGGDGGTKIESLQIFVNGTADAQETANLVMQQLQGRGLMPTTPLR